MVYSFTRRVDGQDIYATHVNELQAAIESLSTDSESYLDATETQALIDAAITGSGDLPASPDFGYDLASSDAGAAAWRGAQVRDIRDWWYEDDTRTDREVFQAMCADIAAAGGGSVAVTAKPEGDGSWGWQIDTPDEVVNLPSNIHLFGAGEGGGQMRPTGGETEEFDHPHIFRVYGPVHNGRIEGLTFKGDNGTDGAGFVYYLNYQSDCIWFMYDGPGNGPYDWTIDHCAFRDLHGFSIHSPGGDPDVAGTMRRINVLNSTFSYCANGVNLNATESKCIGNTMLNSEGFENTGRAFVLSNNTGIDMLHVFISLGGAGQDDGPLTITGNVCHGVTGNGIILAYGQHSAVVSGNVVMDSTGYAFLTGPSPTWEPYDLVVTNNVFKTDPTAPGAVGLSNEGTVFAHNIVGGSTQEPLTISGPNITVQGNQIDLGTGSGRAFQLNNADATNIFFGGDNVYTPFGYYDGSGGVATFAPGSEFRFTSQPTAAAMWRGCKVWVTAGGGVADTYAIATKDAADAYGWRDLLT